MAFSLITLAKKLLITKPNGDEVVDLTTPSIRWRAAFPKIYKMLMVAADMVMRPDIISRVVYGRDDEFDKILKINGISNPFSIDEGDILSIPELGDMEEHMFDPAVQEENERVRNQFIDPTKKRENDTSRADFEAKISALQKNGGIGSNPSRSNLPPNIADEGDSEVKVRGGKVYFGADVTKNKATCSEPISKSELRSRLIKNRLKP
jgi:hypothetical protein